MRPNLIKQPNAKIGARRPPGARNEAGCSTLTFEILSDRKENETGTLLASISFWGDEMPIPTFHINVLNEGPEGTVIVTEYINANETREVLNRLMTRNELHKM